MKSEEFFPIIDAHSHLWLKQDTTWNNLKIKTSEGNRSRSFFLDQEVQMLPPFMIDGRNSAEVFLSNMDYAQVSAAVVTQEFIDGIQNDYLMEVQQRWPDRFLVCGMCDYFRPGFIRQAESLIRNGFRAIKIPAHRLQLSDKRILMTSPEMMQMFHLMEDCGIIFSVDLADGDTNVAEMKEIIQECPRLKIAIGHFGMPTTERWQEQTRLARNEHVYVESGGITWLFNSEFYPFSGAIRAIREAIDICGIDKLMWGSDYPRTITAITYRMSYDFVLKSTELTDEEKRKFLGGNARGFYGFNNLKALPYIKNMSE